MKSENYRAILNNAYNKRELSPKDFDNTLMHFAKLFSKEQVGVTETEYEINGDEFSEIMPNVTPSLKDGDKVSITSEAVGEEDYSGVIAKLYDKIISKMVGRWSEDLGTIQNIAKGYGVDYDKLKKAFFKELDRRKGHEWREKGGWENIGLWGFNPHKTMESTDSKKTNDDTSEIDSLYSDKDDRAIEYGIQNESFDKLMEKFKSGGKRTIKLNERINPKIKKGDLISYIKNKNNVK